MEKLNKIKLISIGLLAITAFLPFVVLCMYNHPSVDDICYVQRAMEYGFWEHQYLRYMEWTGRFTSTFLISSYATLSSEFLGYRLLPLVFMGLLAWGLFYFFKSWFGSRLTDRMAGLMTVILLICFLYGMPEIVQSVYWMTGFVTYQLPIVLLLFLLGYILRKKPPLSLGLPLFLSGVACVFIGGANETTLLFLLIILFFLLGIWRVEYGQWNGFVVCLFFLTGMVALVVLLAPGNVVRGDGFALKHQLGFSILEALKTSVWFAKNKFLETPIPLLLLLYWPFANQLAETRRIQRNLSPVYTMVVSGLLYYSTFFPSYWSLGGPPPTRVLNLSYFLLLVSGLLSLQTILDYFQFKNASKWSIPNWGILTISALFIVFYLVKPNNITTAYQDWLSGSASEYQKEVQHRNTLIKSCPIELCRLPAYKNRPSTIYFDDITENTEDWRNKCYAPVYGKKKVRWQ